MIDTIDARLKRQLFDGAPPNDDVWVGGTFAADRLELTPFIFDRSQYIVLFYYPYLEIGADGDEEVGRTVAAGWSDGYQPAHDARLIKFARADAISDHYEPRNWPLRHPRLAFQFSEVLAEVILLHVESDRSASEYFYLPADRKLVALYDRTFNNKIKPCSNRVYARILEPTGDFYGYRSS